MFPLIPRLRSLFRKWLGKSDYKPRLSTRLTVEEPARLIVGRGMGQPAILQDVSAGGACVRTHQQLRPGERIALAMHLAFDQHYELSARVVYARPSARGSQTRYGVRFVGLADDERRRLDTFVTERANARKIGIRTLAFDIGAR